MTMQSRPRNTATVHCRLRPCAGTSAWFWLGGSVPPCSLRQKFFLKIWLRNGAFWSISECHVDSIAPFSTPACPDCSQKYIINIENCSFLHVFAFYFFTHFPISWLHLPLCADARALVDAAPCTMAPTAVRHSRHNQHNEAGPLICTRRRNDVSCGRGVDIGPYCPSCAHHMASSVKS